MKRPLFESINDYNEFSKYYWYREELKLICKKIGVTKNGTKQELMYYIEQYYNGNIINNKTYKAHKIENHINLESKLLKCGFSFNSNFREYFSKLTNVKNFKFNADMAATWRAVKKNNDINFTIKDRITESNTLLYDPFKHGLPQTNSYLGQGYIVATFIEKRN